MMRVLKIGVQLSLAMVLVILWPLWMLIMRFRSAWKAAVSSPEAKFNMKEETDEDLIASARAQMLEVAIESSFQPILQLYLLFPVLMMQLSCLLNDFLKLWQLTK